MVKQSRNQREGRYAGFAFVHRRSKIPRSERKTGSELARYELPADLFFKWARKQQLYRAKNAKS